MQQGDVLLCQTNDGGEINVQDGLVELSSGLATSAYLSLFGGNEDDAGGSDTTVTWWGNLDEVDPAQQYRSETQNLLRSLPAVPHNLRRLEDSAKRDLQWLLDSRAASSVEVEATMPGLNKVKLTVSIRAVGEESSFEFVENWKASV